MRCIRSWPGRFPSAPAARTATHPSADSRSSSGTSARRLGGVSARRRSQPAMTSPLPSASSAAAAIATSPSTRSPACRASVSTTDHMPPISV